jgi:hypothetical protein
MSRQSNLAKTAQIDRRSSPSRMVTRCSRNRLSVAQRGRFLAVTGYQPHRQRRVFTRSKIRSRVGRQFRRPRLDPSCRSPGGRASDWRTPVRDGAVPTQGRTAFAGGMWHAECGGNSRGVFPEGARCWPPVTGQSLGTAGRHKPRPSVAAAGQAGRGSAVAGTDLWLVY